MVENQKLSERLTLYDLTVTKRSEFQEENRDLNTEQIRKLKILAELGEKIWEFLGVPLVIHSGYRCPALNAAVGSTDRSQHLLCEAIDFVPLGLELGSAFRLLWAEISYGRMNVGQLIHETAVRPYGVSSWLHISLGIPWRETSRCNQILRLENGVYTRLK